jgi:flagellar basal body-associated protein FliL
MMRWFRPALLAMLALPLLLLTGCASTPPFLAADCPVFSDLGTVRANPAGALDRHLAVEAHFRVSPPVEGLAEIKRKRFELKHEILALLSAKTSEDLNVPLRVELLQRELLQMANERIMRKGRVIQVLITGFELE